MCAFCKRLNYSFKVLQQLIKPIKTNFCCKKLHISLFSMRKMWLKMALIYSIYTFASCRGSMNVQFLPISTLVFCCFLNQSTIFCKVVYGLMHQKGFAPTTPPPHLWKSLTGSSGFLWRRPRLSQSVFLEIVIGGLQNECRKTQP